MGKRYLIINADDFGLCKATNDAIEQIFNEGLITSTTIMAVCPEMRDAAERVVRNPRIKAGLHLTFNAEWDQIKWGPVSPAPSVPSLVDENGLFFPDLKSLAAKAEAREVEIEMEAQYNALISAGVRPTHADSHMGSLYGLYGESFMINALDFCRKHKLPFRLVKDFKNTGAGRMRGVDIEALQKKHAEAVKYAKEIGVPLLDDMKSNTMRTWDKASYEALRDGYFQTLAQMEEGVNELFLHPSMDDPVLSENNPSFIMRIWEHRLLLDDAFSRFVEREGFEIISWSDLLTEREERE